MTGRWVMSEREIIFQELCEKNVQGIRSSGAKKVVTISPPLFQHT